MAMAKGGGVRSFRPTTGTDEFEVPVEDQVGPDDDEGGDGDADHGGGRQEDDRQTRKNRRYDGRLSAAEQRAQAAEEAARAANARIEALERQQAPQQQRGPDALKTAYDARMKALNDQDDALASEYDALRTKGALTQQIQENYARKAREIEEQRYEARFRYHQVASAPPQKSPMLALLEAEYPDILGDERRAQWVKSRFDMRLAEGEKDGGITMRREVLEEARQRFDPQRRRPDASQRDLYTSRPVGSGGPRTTTVTVQMGAAQKKMAHARYPNMPKDKAEKLWAETSGKRAALKKQQQA